MTAPTLSEPRPDDEGRETTPSLGQIIDALAEVQWSVAFDCLHHERLTPHGRWVLTHAADVLRALTPHPAPLGATDEGLREAARAFLAVLPWDIGWSPMVKHAHTDLRTALRAALQAGG